MAVLLIVWDAVVERLLGSFTGNCIRNEKATIEFFQ